MSHRHSFALCAFLFAAGVAVPAFAEDHAAGDSKPKSESESKSKPVAKPAEHLRERAEEHKRRPRVESSGYGAWALRCAAVTDKKAGDAAGSKRVCEVSETIAAPNHGGTLAKITIGRPGGGTGPLSAIVYVPNNISFPSSVHIRSDAKDIWGVELQWTRCIPGACLAQTVLADATVKYWQGLKSTGSLVFRDAAGDEVKLPMTFEGFGEALEAFDKAQ